MQFLGFGHGLGHCRSDQVFEQLLVALGKQLRVDVAAEAKVVQAQSLVILNETAAFDLALHVSGPYVRVQVDGGPTSEATVAAIEVPAGATEATVECIV